MEQKYFIIDHRGGEMAAYSLKHAQSLAIEETIFTSVIVLLCPVNNPHQPEFMVYHGKVYQLTAEQPTSSES